MVEINPVHAAQRHDHLQRTRALDSTGAADLCRSHAQHPRANPPELTADIIDRGLLLTGGGARLQGIDAYLAEQIGIPVTIADNAEDAVALGAAEALDNLDIVGPNLLAQESVLSGADTR